MENKKVKNIFEKAMKLNEYGTQLPDSDIKIGQIVELQKIWDGEGDVPETDYCYQLNDMDYLDYCFDTIEEKRDLDKENLTSNEVLDEDAKALHNLIRITNIRLI